jgi:hypothetical protein
MTALELIPPSHLTRGEWAQRITARRYGGCETMLDLLDQQGAAK